ncbi:HTH_Tnp_Tc3_2 domain-containing protein [Trichonephila clavipes]|uniref:HTH_Tnp_Tc3_2 domain-containing protein n=1 Tax=Trichonephila clavipes TaxID=2585209 RepID=A0A8X6VKE5_TRICX|nr:HTH_Tnp_Tc3_2 domain-containing protein [Trichonephila clavipes]
MQISPFKGQWRMLLILIPIQHHLNTFDKLSCATGLRPTVPISVFVPLGTEVREQMFRKKTRNHDISVGVRNLISHWKEEKSVHSIGKILKLSKFTVFNIIDKFKKTNSVDNNQRSGSPKIFNEREERWIARQRRINTRTSAVKMTLKCKSRFGKYVNPETVKNVLRKHKYRGRVPQRNPYISKANRPARLAFAKMYVSQQTKFGENAILVEESKYKIFGSDGKQNVWRK